MRLGQICRSRHSVRPRNSEARPHLRTPDETSPNSDPWRSAPQLTRRSQTHRAGENQHPSQTPKPAAGPLLRPSLALNLDPAPGPIAPTSPRPPTCISYSPRLLCLHFIQPQVTQTHPGRGLYQIQARPHLGSTRPQTCNSPSHTEHRPGAKHQPCLKCRPRDRPPS